MRLSSLLGLGPGDGGGNGRLLGVHLCGGFGCGGRGLNGVFGCVHRCLTCDHRPVTLRLGGLLGLGTCQGGGDGGLLGIQLCLGMLLPRCRGVSQPIALAIGGLGGTTGDGLLLARLTGGNHGLVVRCGFTHGHLGRLLFGLDAGQGGGDRIFAPGRRHGLATLGCGLGVAGFAGRLLTLEASLLGLEALLGTFGLLGLGTGLADVILGDLVVLHQGDFARADPGTGAALDTVKEVELLGLVVLLDPAVPVKLLGQQGGGAGIGAGTATDAGLFRAGGRQLGAGGGEQAVGGLDHGDHGVGQGEAHHGAPHDDPLIRLRLQLETLEQPAYRRAQTHPGIAGFLEGVAGEGDDALDERLPIDDGALDGKDGGDVEHHDAHVDRPASLGHLASGEQLYGLFGAAGGVLGRYRLDQHVGVAGMAGQGLDGRRFVVFHPDQGELGLEQVLEYPDAVHDLVGVFLHQTVICGDVGFALQPVDDEDLGELATAVELAVGREDGAAEPGDAGLLDALEQRPPLQVPVVRLGCALAPGIVSVRGEEDAEIVKTGGVRHRVLLDGGDGARGGSVHRHDASLVKTGEGLPLLDLVPHPHQQFAGRTRVLAHRNDELGGKARVNDGGQAGLVLVLGGMDAAVKIPQSAGFDAFEQMLHGYSAVYSTILTGMATLARSHFQLSTVVGTGIISIQSVGQGSTQRSHPVHSAAMTVCIALVAPRMASTGQAWMHLVQPMHMSS